MVFSSLQVVLLRGAKNFFQATLAPTIGCCDLVSDTVVIFHVMPSFHLSMVVSPLRLKMLNMVYDQQVASPGLLPSTIQPI